MKKIVSVQDISCYGQCSLTVALPVLSAYGIETAILPSSILSTHTGGFKNFTVFDLTEEMPRIVNHWKEENIKFDAVYTGYIGDSRQFDLIKDMRSLLSDGGLMLVDPAMADYGKLYVALNDEIVKGMRKLVESADVIVPNLTEAAFLLDEEYRDDFNRDDIIAMAKKLSAMGPATVIMTGVSLDKDHIGALAYDKASDSITEYYAEKMTQNYHGTGDIFSSVVFANILNGQSLYDSIKDACEFVVKCIKNTMGDDTHNYGVKFESVLCTK